MAPSVEAAPPLLLLEEAPVVVPCPAVLDPDPPPVMEALLGLATPSPLSGL